ncbi:MAG TPA: hypothetical protein VK324_03140 [Tepidisphaeraceae bacterium]|nr:hypothetical protein [Tepidisphaeraceae bacterium]
MKYLQLKWKETDTTLPSSMVCEIDDEGWERRKVEFWSDGRKGYASSDAEVGGTGIGLEPWLPEHLGQLFEDPEFEAVRLDRSQFEQIWANRETPSAMMP